MKKLFILFFVMTFILAMTGCAAEETVEYVMPAGTIDTTDFDGAKYAKETSGVKAAELNEDGTVTITMTKSDYDEMMTEIKATFDENIKEFESSDDTPYIKSIDYDDEMKNFEVKVDRAGYEENYIEMTPFYLSMMAEQYQIFMNVEYGTVIKIVDEATGDVILEETYPEAE